VGNPKTPAGLSPEAKKLFCETRDQYGIDDAPSLTLLGNACRALDRLRLAESLVKKEGAVYTDRFGQPKAHPAAARVDAENLTLQRSLRELGINLAPLPGGSGPPEGV
jgi:phage terminase small subunit